MYTDMEVSAYNPEISSPAAPYFSPHTTKFPWKFPETKNRTATKFPKKSWNFQARVSPFIYFTGTVVQGGDPNKSNFLRGALPHTPLGLLPQTPAGARCPTRPRRATRALAGPSQEEETIKHEGGPAPAQPETKNHEGVHSTHTSHYKYNIKFLYGTTHGRDP